MADIDHGALREHARQVNEWAADHVAAQERARQVDPYVVKWKRGEESRVIAVGTQHQCLGTADDLASKP